MEIADELLWQYAGEQDYVPLDGFGDTPDHVRLWIARWLRLRAFPCEHLQPWRSIPDLALRAVGHPVAWCPACASNMADHLSRCAHCVEPLTPPGRSLVLSLGRVLILGAWCDRCWNEGDTE